MRSTLFAVLLCAACASEAPVETRVCNLTGFPIRGVTYSDYDVADLSNGECSEYQTATYDLFEYTYVKFWVGGDLFLLQPIHFDAENPLKPGRWSYEVRISDYSTRSVRLTAVED